MESGRHSSADKSLAQSSASNARQAFHAFGDWLRERPSTPLAAMQCGSTHYDLLLRRGHQCLQPRADLLEDAKKSLDAECRTLKVMANEAAGSWPAVQERLAQNHPLPAEYLDTFE